MNIFVLDENPAVAAIYHGDKHVVKMILETAQLLSTAHHYYHSEFVDQVYRKTHLNHPAAIWVRTNSTNYTWAYSLLINLLQEYTHRYNKVHATSKLVNVLVNLPGGIPVTSKLTPFALTMPDQYKVPGDAVQSYRNYYLHEKRATWSWKNRPLPYWISEK